MWNLVPRDEAVKTTARARSSAHRRHGKGRNKDQSPINFGRLKTDCGRTLTTERNRKQEDRNTKLGGQDPRQRPEFLLRQRGPHGFEYHAVLDHDHNNPFNLRKQFGSFFEGLPGFRQFPNLNAFPGITEILVKLTPTTPRPVYRDVQEVAPRPTHSPRARFKPAEGPPPVNELFRRKDGMPAPKSLGKNKLLAEEYPKIFKFNDERINIIDFDRSKKYGSDHASLNRGDYLDPDKILRDKFLILHGGVFKMDDSGPVERSEPLTGNRIEFENLPKPHIHYYYT
ncbi:uncharacterized protein [Centruroides vittatus]|uniref:uncharacterized protein n=1 Tax=Centruroides vittatus TaxID=120091 RepID=UPI00351015D2